MSFEVWRTTIHGTRALYGTHRFRFAARVRAWWVRGEVVKRDV